MATPSEAVPWCVLAMAALAALALPSPAHAWWRGGVWIGFPPIAPYYYYPPPVVYAPPPAVYVPPPAAYAPPSAGVSCYAGAYICPLDAPAPIGGACSCPTNTGRIGGRVG
ncbi:MAG: hypothetical protein J0I21_14410 [Alphaproteobacteria bacterium]|nr:hypothetical protein [Alphaproteobacteria bacterium]